MHTKQNQNYNKVKNTQLFIGSDAKNKQNIVIVKYINTLQANEDEYIAGSPVVTKCKKVIHWYILHR